MSSVQNPYDIPLNPDWFLGILTVYWLMKESPYNWVGFHPLYQTTNLGCKKNNTAQMNTQKTLVLLWQASLFSMPGVFFFGNSSCHPDTSTPIRGRQCSHVGGNKAFKFHELLTGEGLGMYYSRLYQCFKK